MGNKTYYFLLNLLLASLGCTKTHRAVVLNFVGAGSEPRNFDPSIHRTPRH